MRAVAYCRVSTEDQATDGLGLGAQQQAVQAYAAMRGFELVDVVVDPGVSAGKPFASREGGSRVLSLVQARKVDAVVALKLDRLFRDCRDCLEVTGQWERRGVALHLVDLGGQAVDTSTAAGKFFLTVLAAAGEMERNMICERTAAALQYKASKGECVGQVPYGYALALDGVQLEKEAAEQAVLTQMRGWREQGASIRRIADRLNAADTPARGRRWHKTTVGRLLAR